jgi:2-methylisocitrate lyase-like PEP mutase family enzyme
MAIATGSWSVAAAHGTSDGERLPFDLVLDNARRIAGAIGLPVSLDIESGYGVDREAVFRTFARIASTGVVGCNIEDSDPTDGRLRPQAEQVARLGSARQAADAALPRFFINARTDVFLQIPSSAYDDALLADVIARGKAYADAGADGFFVPGLVDPALMERLVAASPLPVNVMVVDATPPLRVLMELGIARVSHGPRPYRLAMAALADAARRAMDRSR